MNSKKIRECFTLRIKHGRGIRYYKFCFWMDLFLGSIGTALHTRMLTPSVSVFRHPDNVR